MTQRERIEQYVELIRNKLNDGARELSNNIQLIEDIDGFEDSKDKDYIKNLLKKVQEFEEHHARLNSMAESFDPETAYPELKEFAETADKQSVDDLATINEMFENLQRMLKGEKIDF